MRNFYLFPLIIASVFSFQFKAQAGLCGSLEVGWGDLLQMKLRVDEAVQQFKEKFALQNVDAKGKFRAVDQYSDAGYERIKKSARDKRGDVVIDGLVKTISRTKGEDKSNGNFLGGQRDAIREIVAELIRQDISNGKWVDLARAIFRFDKDLSIYLLNKALDAAGNKDLDLFVKAFEVEWTIELKSHVEFRALILDSERRGFDKQSLLQKLLQLENPDLTAMIYAELRNDIQAGNQIHTNLNFLVESVLAAQPGDEVADENTRFLGRYFRSYAHSPTIPFVEENLLILVGKIGLDFLRRPIVGDAKAPTTLEEVLRRTVDVDTDAISMKSRFPPPISDPRKEWQPTSVELKAYNRITVTIAARNESTYEALLGALENANQIPKANQRGVVQAVREYIPDIVREQPSGVQWLYLAHRIAVIDPPLALELFSRFKITETTTSADLATAFSVEWLANGQGDERFSAVLAKWTKGHNAFELLDFAQFSEYEAVREQAFSYLRRHLVSGDGTFNKAAFAMFVLPFHHPDHDYYLAQREQALTDLFNKMPDLANDGEVKRLANEYPKFLEFLKRLVAVH